MPQGRIDEAMRWVPDEVIDTMTITGTLDDSIARVSDYQGVADEVIMARTGQQDGRHTLADYADFFRLSATINENQGS